MTTQGTGVPDPLARHILSLADTKRILGIRYSDWLLGAPSIETGIAASSMAQDEWGHARLLYSMLKDFDFDPFEVEHERPAERYYSAPALDGPFEDWADFTAAVAIVDRALEIALESLSSGSFELARSRVPKMLAEEEFHRSFGDAWFVRLCEAEGEGRTRLGEAVNTMLPSTLAWLSPDDDPFRQLVETGHVRTPEELRNRFNASFGPLAQQLGLDIASAQADRSGWDEERRRGPGAPGEEAVERARGDRNRALFVE